MISTTKKELRFGRAMGLFLVGYLAISVVGALTSVLIAVLLRMPPSIEAPNVSYVLYENCLVLLNVLVWIPLSVWYFKGDSDIRHVRKESLLLGLGWAVMAVLLDFLLFAFLPGPLYLGAYNFFIVQFPWIYLIYMITFLTPLVSTELRKILAKRSAVS